MAEPLSATLNDFVVQRTVGSRAFLNGRTYARQKRVRDLSVDPAGRLLHAAVQGTRSAPYHVVVTPTSRAQRWSGRCTCPIGVDCKHVAAVMIAARGSDPAPEAALPPDAKPAWEGAIGALVRAHTTVPVRSETPLALQFEVHDVPPPGRWAGPETELAARQRIRIRPLLWGASGRWVRTGASWRDLQLGMGPGNLAKAHREALRAIFAGYLANNRAHYRYHGYGADATIHLDELGAAIWHLLRQASEAGLALVPVKASAGPVIVAGPAAISLDLRKVDGVAGAALEPVVAFGDQLLPAAKVEFLGKPIHGLFLTYPPAAALIGRAAGLDEPPGIVLAPVPEWPADDIGDFLRRGQRLDIPSEDLPRFLQAYYPGLRQVVAVRSSDDSVTLPEVVPPRLALTVTFSAAHNVRLEWSFAYTNGESFQHVALEAKDAPDGKNASVPRDRREEQRLLADLDPSVRHILGPPLTLAGMDTVAFTQDVLPVLRSQEDLLLTIVGEPPDYRHVELPPVIRLSATDSPDSSDWYDLAVSVSVDGEEIPFNELFVALALEQSHLVLDSGSYFSIERPEFEQLRKLIAEARALQDRQSDGLRLSVYQAGLWEELRELGIVEAQSTRWAGIVQGLLEVDAVPPPSLPVGFEAELRPYQRDGYNWLSFLWEHGLGGILADDMGLGKTIQTLALICRAREAGELPGPFLVVAPTSVVGNWAHEAARFAPGLKVGTVLETTARRQTPLAEDIAGADLVITSYALFRIDFESYESLPWAGLLLDEAQNVKNHLAKTYQCARRLAAPFKLAITGTPLENSLMDLWSLLSIVAPGLFPSPQRFSDHFRRPIERGDDPELLASLRRRIRPLMRRRTKDQVMAELPPKQEQVLEVDLNPRHQKIYQTHLQRERQKVLGLLDDLDKNRFAIFRSLTLLRQLSLHAGLVDPAYGDVRSSKADAFLDQLREVVSEGHRALVFSQFTGFLRVIRDQLDVEGIPYSYLDGRTRNRPARIEEFKTGDNPVFLISLKAGGVGLNLTEADYCFILDPWWNPAVEAQAVDRTHRIGQDKTVMVYRLVAAGTIEEKVMALKARKQSLFTRVLDDGDLLSAPLSVEDIKGLFG